ncbi:MAG: L-lactate permease [Thermoleophilaceae bacterium]
MYHQVYDPVSNSLGLTAIFAVLPIVTLFILLGGLKMKAHWAALISLAVALAVAIFVYPMPVGQAFDSAAEGAAFGLFPIMWIVVNAVWIYNMTTETGDFAVLRRSFGTISSDERVQAVIIAFSFGALLEALAGFGTPVAICSVMLVALGFKPIKAVAVALVADTVPVAFGAIAIPITTLSQVSGLPKGDLASMVGRQTPFLSLLVPLIIVAMVDGRRGIRQAWPVALVGGLSFAIGQFATSNYISAELTDIVASLISVASIVLMLRVWQPPHDEVPAETRQRRFARPAVAGASTYNPALEEDVRRRDLERAATPSPLDRDEPPQRDGRGAIVRAYSPYVIIIAVLGLAQLGPIKTALSHTIEQVQWPGLHVVNGKGKVPTSLTYKLDYLPAAGTLLLISGLLTIAALRIRPGIAVRSYLATLNQLKWAILTVATVLAIAYVMNLSGQTITLGLWAAGAGGAFAFLSSWIGWLGVSITGSDTASNSLFGALQVTAAKSANLNPTLMAAANSSGGVIGKMISPQNLAIGVAAVGMSGEEGRLFRKVIGWSLLLVLLMAGLVYLQSTSLLSWMVP